MLQQMGIAHRDIKPDNIMVNKKHDLRLIDLGSARYLEKQEEKKQKGCIRSITKDVTTPSYAALEVLRGKEYDTLADMWSVGITFSNLLDLGACEFERLRNGGIVERPTDDHPDSYSKKVFVSYSKKVSDFLETLDGKSGE